MPADFGTIFRVAWQILLDVHQCAGIHRIAYDRVRAGRDNPLVLDNLDSRRGERVFLDHSVHHPHAEKHHEVTQYDEPRNDERRYSWEDCPRTIHRTRWEEKRERDDMA